MVAVQAEPRIRRFSQDLRWPGGSHVAVVFNIAYEAWSDGKAPGIGPMGNPLPPGTFDTNALSWGRYGQDTGIERLLRILDRTHHKASVMVSGILAERAPQHAIAPVTDVLEDQQAQYHFGRSAKPAAATALGMPFHQRFVHGGDDLLVRQHLIGVRHPDFAEIAHFLSDQSIAEAELRASHLNHGSSSRASPRFSPDAANRG